MPRCIAALLTGLLRNVAVKCEDGTYLGARNVKLNLFPGSVLAKKRPEFIMVAEIVETDRLYGRIAAKICLSGSNQSPNTWSGAVTSSPIGNGPAGAFRPTCGSRSSGLPSSPNARSTTPGSIPKQRAKSSFVRPGTRRIRTRASFFAHNRAIVEKVETLAHKTRRRDLVVDNQAVYAFFDPGSRPTCSRPRRSSTGANRPNRPTPASCTST